ncbi:MAG: FUN14 domain-containing protein [Verrucomicrobiota bacterium]
MNVFFQKIPGFFTGWFGDGPWRSKSVLAAFAVVLVGLGFWCSDIKNGPPQKEMDNAAANASGITPPNAAGAVASSHWNWGKPFPGYVRMGASYVAGFCIGWFFRKVTRLVWVVAALLIALLAFGKYVGCDTTHTQEQVKRSGEWVQHEAMATKDYLKHVLPSATAGGVGTFLGFRRRSKVGASKAVA